MSLVTLHYALIKRKEQIKDVLNQTSTILAIRPLDTVETTYQYFMLFRSRSDAELIAEQALTVIKEDDGVRASSFVSKIEDMTSFQLLTDENAFLVTLRLGDIIK